MSVGETRQMVQDENGDPFNLRTGGGRDVTLTLPDGRRTTFTYSLQPAGNFRLSAVWTAARFTWRKRTSRCAPWRGRRLGESQVRVRLIPRIL